MAELCSNDHFSRLSDELVLQILANLEPANILHVQRTSRRFFGVARDHLLWAKMCRRDFGPWYRKRSGLGPESYRLNHNWRKPNYTLRREKVCNGDLCSHPVFAYHRGWGCVVSREYCSDLRDYTTWKVRFWNIDDSQIEVFEEVRTDSEGLPVDQFYWPGIFEPSPPRLQILVDSTCKSEHEVKVLILWADTAVTCVRFDVKEMAIHIDQRARNSELQALFGTTFVCRESEHHVSYANSHLAFMFPGNVYLLKYINGSTVRRVIAHGVPVLYIPCIEWRQEDDRLVLGLVWISPPRPRIDGPGRCHDVQSQSLIVSTLDDVELQSSFSDTSVIFQVPFIEPDGRWPAPIGTEIDYHHPFTFIRHLGVTYLYRHGSGEANAKMVMNGHSYALYLRFFDGQKSLCEWHCDNMGSPPPWIDHYPMTPITENLWACDHGKECVERSHRFKCENFGYHGKPENHDNRGHKVQSTWTDDRKMVSLVKTGQDAVLTDAEMSGAINERVFSYVLIRDFS